MGYCGNPMCNDPNCVGGLESGPWPARVRVRDSWTSEGYRVVDISAGEYKNPGLDEQSGRYRQLSVEEVLEKARKKGNREGKG